MRRVTREDLLDPLVHGGIPVEDGGAVQQPDATDGAPQDEVVVRRGGEGGHEREERMAAVAPSDVQRRTRPAPSAYRVGGASELVALARLGA